MSRLAAYILLSFLALLLPWSSWASCTVTPTSPVVMTFQGFTAPIDTKVADGTPLYTTTVNLGTVPGHILCTAPWGYLEQRGTRPSLNGAVYPVAGLYDSGIPGIGYQLAAYGAVTGADTYPTGQQFGVGYDWYINPGLTLQVTFVKTGEIKSTGTVVGEIGGWFAENGVTQVVSIQITGSIVVVPKAPTCSLATPSIPVSLPDVNMSAFSGQGRTATSTAKDFNIQLNCSGGDPGTSTGVYVTLTDSTRPSNTTDMLSPTAATAATGVGVRIFNGGTPVKYGPDSATVGNTNQWRITTVSPGSTIVNIPLTANYVQVSPQVQSGQVAAIATFTMGYN